MTRDPRHPSNRPPLWLAGACAALLALAGCKSDKDGGGGVGVGTSRPKDKADPLVFGPTKIPKQDLPVPDRATGPRIKPDPLTSPTGGKAGYIDDPERFKGTFIPGKASTPAALSGRRPKDDDGLKIDDGSPLVPAGGALPNGDLGTPEGVSGLYTQLERLGVSADDRSLTRENGQYVFLASVPISGNGAKRRYEGKSESAAEAVRRVLDQVAADQKR